MLKSDYRYIIFKSTVFLSLSLTSLLGVYSYGSVSKTCTSVFMAVDDTKSLESLEPLESKQPLSWTYFGSIVSPQIKLPDISPSEGTPYDIKLRGGLKKESSFVVYYRSTFSMAPNARPELVYDNLSSTSETFKETFALANHLYSQFYTKNSKSEEIAFLRNTDEQLSPIHVGWIVYHADNLKDPQVMIRVVDTAETANPLGFLKDKNIPPQKLPIEIQYPHLKLPERVSGKTMVELGRLGKTKDVDGDLRTLLRTASNYLHQRFFGETDNIVIYVEASPAAARLYTSKYGFELAYRPEDLKIPTNEKQFSILKIDAKDFIQRFLFFDQNFFK